VSKTKVTPDLPPGFRNDPLLKLHWALSEQLDALYSLFTSGGDFVEIRVRSRDDGSCYALAKRLGPDGAPLVAFGSGYDAISAIAGLEGAIHANKWRPDKPYKEEA
jgi:hypothetical protein